MFRVLSLECGFTNRSSCAEVLQPKNVCPFSKMSAESIGDTSTQAVDSRPHIPVLSYTAILVLLAAAKDYYFNGAATDGIRYRPSFTGSVHLNLCFFLECKQ